MHKMKSREKTKSQLIGEVEALRKRLSEFEETQLSHTDHAQETPILQQSSGIRKALNRIKPNDHLCLIYESLGEWRAAIIPFIATGLKRGEKCVYILGTNTADRIRNCLREEGVNVTDAEALGKLLILHETDVWRRESPFDPDGIIALLISEADKAIDDGYPGIRMTQEIPSKFKDRLDSEKLLRYEAKLNRDFFPRYPCAAICQYDRWKCDPQIIKNAIMTHPLLVRDDQVYQNFYYIPPEEFLAQKRDEREIQDMLNSVEQEGETQKRVRFLSNVLQLSSQPFSASYPDGHVMYCNPAFCALTGYTEEELRTMTWALDLTPSEWRESETKMLNELHRTGEPQVYEKECIRKDGSLVLIEVFMHRICDDEGNLKYYYRFVSDITERKQAEDALRRNEMRCRNLVETAGAGVVATDLRGRFTFVNEGLCKMIGYSEEELIGKHFINFLHPGEKRRILKLFWNSFMHATGRLHLEFKVIHKRGHIVHMYSNPTISKHKNRIVGFNAIIHDITAGKKMEEELRKSEERLRCLIESQAEGIGFTDTAERFVFVNAAGHDIFGVPPRSLIGRSLKEFTDAENFSLIRAQTELRESGRKSTYEVGIVRPDEEGRILLVSATPEFDNRGRFVGTFAIFYDITERKKTEDVLRQERDEAVLMLRELSS